MSYWEYAAFVMSHMPRAAICALLFMAGMALAVPVLQRRIEFFLSTPRWFAGMLAGFMSRHRTVAPLAAMIFLFNSTAILVYMLTGIVPLLPYLVAMMTGLNVALAGLMGHEMMPMPAGRMRPPSLAARVCGLLTFLLELPCFWFVMAMGATLFTELRVAWPDFGPPILKRVTAYLLVIVPILALSALVEAYAVAYPLKMANREDAEDAKNGHEEE